MPRHIFMVFSALVAASSLSAQSEQPTPWPVGSRVRVWTAANRNVAGQLKDVRADTLIIEMTGILTHQVTLPTSRAVRVDVSDGKRISPTNIAKGAVGGAALGALTTLVRDDLLGDLCPDGECERRHADYKLAMILGAAVGAAAGATRLEDKWREIPLPTRLKLSIGAKRTSVGVSLAFR